MSILDDNLQHLDSSNPSRFSTKAKKTGFWANLTTQKIFALGVVALVVIGLPVAVVLLQRNQDLRQKASTATGTSVVTGRSNGSLSVGQPASIILSINTNSVPVQGVQVEFTIDTSQSGPLSAAPIIPETTASGLQLFNSTPTLNSNGTYTVTVAAVSTSPTQPFSSSSALDFATIQFTPTSAGNITFQFNQTYSQVQVFEANMIQYSALLMMIAHVTGYEPYEYIHSFSDAHIYVDQVEKVKEIIAREPRPLPTVKMINTHDNIFDFRKDDFELSNYHPHPSMKDIPVAI